MAVVLSGLGQAGEWGILPEPGRHPAIAMIDANVPIVFAEKLADYLTVQGAGALAW